MKGKSNYWYDSHFYSEMGRDFTTRCEDCGNRIPVGEGYYQVNGKPYCEECVESADLENLVRICETETDELYRSMGMIHQYVGAERG